MVSVPKPPCPSRWALPKSRFVLSTEDPPSGRSSLVAEAGPLDSYISTGYQGKGCAIAPSWEKALLSLSWSSASGH